MLSLPCAWPTAKNFDNSIFLSRSGINPDLLSRDGGGTGPMKPGNLDLVGSWRLSVGRFNFSTNLKSANCELQTIFKVPIPTEARLLKDERG